MNYCETIYRTCRRKTREVKVGKVGVGGDNPIRIQSMTTSDTRDVQATIEQIIRLADLGCEIVRVTVQGKREAEACEEIKNGLLQRGYEIPLVADIHFYPPAALMVAEFADKVRVNPGNYVDRRATFKVMEYDDATYQRELEKVEEIFSPLVEKCKRLGKAIRIGTNHGSLSDRIMNRYGDSPQGMVESALEFARVCRKYDFHDFLFSMKASNPTVMIHAYRLLVAKMMELGWDYPLHLGVTEAGQGEDGRIKSAMGIGALLLDGIGDTIRVSLTEDPWDEIDPCKRIVHFFNLYNGKGVEPFQELHRDIYQNELRPIIFREITALHKEGSVILKRGDQWVCEDRSLDSLLIRTGDEWEKIKRIKGECIVFHPTRSPLHETRQFADWLKEEKITTPLIVAIEYSCSKEDLPIQAGAEFGAILCDRLAQGICLITHLPEDEIQTLSLNLLQSARMRMTKTDFISCPGCGRTLFDLKEVSKRIREKTAHLPGVKIAIMGCIVNGPGEMADADFGYVGSKPGKIDLYVGKNCVEKDIEFHEADVKLIDLIKTYRKWVEPNEIKPL